MSFLLIDENIKNELKSLKEYSEKNEYSLDELLDIKNGVLEPPGDSEYFGRFISNGYKVVFTIENHPGGKFRHMSLSVNNKTPHPEATKLIMQELGFKNKLEDCIVYLELDVYLNVIEPYK